MRISVIIPTYQHAKTLPECLNSIFAQTRSPDEIIVVNDGSTDGTDRLLAQYANGLLPTPGVGSIDVVTQENQGGNVARNVGFARSTGDLVIFCDADVVMAPDMLSSMEKALIDHPEASYAYSGFRFGWKSFSSFPFDANQLRQMNFVHSTSLLRRDRFPGFDPSVRRFQDWDVWLTMLGRGHIGTFIDRELFRVIDRSDRPSISQWRPSFLYRIPWNRIGWKPASVRRYEEAKRIIVKKHGL